MFLYGSKFGENPTFAPSYDDAVARESSQADAASALWNASRDAQIYRENLQASDWSRAEAYERRNKAIFEATGVQLENPFRASPEELSRSKRERQFSGSQGFKNWRDRLESEWQQKVSELARERPEFANVIQPGRAIDDDMFQVTRDTETAEQTASAQAEAAGLSLPRRLFASLGGGFAGMLRDPVQVATLFVGGGISAPARFASVRILETILTEAAINGGVEAGVQLASHEYREQAGVDTSLSSSLKQVGLTALFGGGFGGVMQGGREVFRLLGRDAPAAELARIANGEAEPGDMAAVSRALGIDADQATLRAADMAAEQSALDRAAFGDPPAGIDPAAAERMAADAVRIAESPEDMRISRVVAEQFPIGPPPKKPVTLMQFLASRAVGGIKDENGELAAMGLSRRFVPGGGVLVRERGKSLDMAREAAAEAGYFDHIYGDPDRATALSTPDDLLRLLQGEAGGKPAYSARNDGGREFEWMEYERSQKAQEAYRRLLEEIDGTASALDLGPIDDHILVRAAELVDEETDHITALEKAFDEDYRLNDEGDIDLGELPDAELEIPFFQDRQDAGGVSAVGRSSGESRAEGEFPGERGPLEADGEQLSRAGGAEGAPAQRLRQPGETPEPATAEAGALAELALTESRIPNIRQLGQRLGVGILEQRGFHTKRAADSTIVREAVTSYLEQNAQKVKPADIALETKAQWAYVLDSKGFVWRLADPTHDRFLLSIGREEGLHDEAVGEAAELATFRLSRGRGSDRLHGGIDFYGMPNDRQVRSFRQMQHALGNDGSFSVSMWRNQDAPASERTPAGEQTLIEGVKPVSTKEKLEVEADKPLRGGDVAPPEGGLFDLDARDQLDIWDAMPAAKGADGSTLHATHDTMIADADRTEFFGDLIAACKD